MGLSIEKFEKFFMYFIAIPVVLITVTTMLKISNNCVPFEGFQKVLGAKNHNNSSLGLEGIGIVQNMTHQNLGEEKSNTIEVLQGKTQNNHTTSQEIATDAGPSNDSTNDSTTDFKDDKFMDGLLLASGIDESRCLSRYQSYLYRKASPYKPSPYLISKLRNYEQLHKRCGPNTIAYNTTMTKIIIPSSSETDDHHHYNDNNVSATMCKYVIWSPIWGLGNRIISIASTFLYAVLTGRVLLVKFEPDMHGLFCEPFQETTWILPKNSPIWNHENVETYKSVLAKVDKARNLTMDQLSLPSALFINLLYLRGYPERFFHCDLNQEALKKVDVLIVVSGHYFVPSLFMTPSFSLELNKMFPEKNAVFHHIGRYLFHPSNEVWGQITRFYDVYLAKANERIGLQVRMFKSTTPKQSVMDLLLSCVIKNKILPEIDSRNSASNEKNTNHTLKAVLVASLYPEYAENLRTMYLKGPTVTGEVIGVYQPSHEEEQKFNDNVHNIKALVDMYLLSLCDVLVTTSASTFGYVAHGFRGLKPWLLSKPTSKNETDFPACVRDFSPEPCFHFAPQFQCNGIPKEHFGASFPNIFECNDYNGLKLGDSDV